MRSRPLVFASLLSLAACRSPGQNQVDQREAPQPATAAVQDRVEPAPPSGPAFASCPNVVPPLRPLVSANEAPVLALPPRLLAPLGGAVPRNHELFDPDCDGVAEALVIGDGVFAYVDDDLHVDLGPIVTEHGGAEWFEALALLIPRSGPALLGVVISGVWLLGRIDADGKFVQLGEVTPAHGECRGALSPWFDDHGFLLGFEVAGCGRLRIDGQTGAVTPQTGDAALEPVRWPGVPLPPLTRAAELPANIDLDSCARQPRTRRIDCGEFTLTRNLSSLAPADWRAQYERLSGVAGLSLTWESVAWPGFEDAEIELARSSEQGRPMGVEFIVSVAKGDRFEVSQCMSMLSGRPHDAHTLARAQRLCAAAIAAARE